MKYVREGTYARGGEARSGRGIHARFLWKRLRLQQHARSRTENYEMSFDTAEEEKKRRAGCAYVCTCMYANPVNLRYCDFYLCSRPLILCI